MDLKHMDLITINDPKSSASEAYRSLRTNLQFANVDADIKTILVSSSIEMEGKSTTIANLAVVTAQANKKTLLIDCDLRKPVLHKIFKIENKDKGLTKLLTDDLALEDVVKTVIPNLDVIPSGNIPPNPSELLHSRRMRRFIENTKERYDMVFFDAPPVIPVTDAAALSTFTDGLILVVSANWVRKKETDMALKAFKTVNANVLGFVMTGVKPSDMKGYGKPYYYDNSVQSAGFKKRVLSGWRTRDWRLRNRK